MKKMKKNGYKMKKWTPEVTKTEKKAVRATLGEGWSKRRTVLTVLAGALVVVNLVLGLVALSLTHSQPKPAEPTEVVEVEEPAEPEEPEEPEVNTDPLVAEPENIDPANYQVAPNKPRYLSIPAIGLVNIPVTEFGVTPSNQLGSPVSTRVVGWYYQSAFPGKRGVTVMNAHGGDLGTGIFKTLPQAKVGTEVIIEMGDGRKYTYVIEEMNYKKLGTEANNYMHIIYEPLRENVPTLTMITCTGRWLRELQTYDQRLFVRASLRE